MSPVWGGGGVGGDSVSQSIAWINYKMQAYINYNKSPHCVELPSCFILCGASVSQSAVFEWLNEEPSLCVLSRRRCLVCVCVGRRHVHQPRAAGTSEGREVGRDRLLQAPRRDGGKPQSGASGGRGHEEEPGEWVRLALIDGRLSRLLCFGLWLLSKGARWSDWFCFIVSFFHIKK